MVAKEKAYNELNVSLDTKEGEKAEIELKGCAAG